RISGKSNSLMKPSSLSSVRLITSGVDSTWLELGNGEPTASGASSFSPPQRNSRLGSTCSNGTAGSVQVGSTPEPLHVPTSQLVKEGQSQSSSQVQPTPLLS